MVSWRSDHPVAASQLCSFSRYHPTEFRRVEQWVRDHPTQARQLLDWAASNRGMPIPPAMMQTQPGWNGYEPWRDPAFYALLEWAADNPGAAQDLVDTPRGIEWAIDGRNC